MRVVLQEVIKASVTIDKKLFSSINKGYLLLVSFTHNDTEEIASKMALKISKLRIFMDGEGKANLSLSDVCGEILSVSQFTLYADAKHGNRPSFTDCMEQKTASNLYNFFNQELRNLDFKVSTGVFGADMKVELINDGPFTLMLDSKDLLK
jgi:D-aminoacyl-tRNA deacylase